MPPSLSRFLPEKRHLIRVSNESIRRESRLLVDVNAPKYYIEKITSDHLCVNAGTFLLIY